MEYYEQQKIREKWGDKPCEHVHLEKLYYTNAFLTVYVCSDCGKEFTIAEKLDRDLKKKKSA
jgi:transposase-like protein